MYRLLGLHWNQEIHTRIEWYVGFLSELHYVFPHDYGFVKESTISIHSNEYVEEFTLLSELETFQKQL